MDHGPGWTPPADRQVDICRGRTVSRQRRRSPPVPKTILAAATWIGIRRVDLCVDDGAFLVARISTKSKSCLIVRPSTMSGALLQILLQGEEDKHLSSEGFDSLRPFRQVYRRQTLFSTELVDIDARFPSELTYGQTL